MAPSLSHTYSESDSKRDIFFSNMDIFLLFHELNVFMNELKICYILQEVALSTDGRLSGGSHGHTDMLLVYHGCQLGILKCYPGNK